MSDTGRVMVAIVGSRTYKHPDSVRRFVRGLHESTIVVSGGARGVDRVAESEARACGLEVVIKLPDWDKEGRRAGFMRNTEIVEAADVVVAFWDGKSNGTRDTIAKALEAGKLMAVFKPRKEKHGTHGMPRGELPSGR